MIFCLVFGLLTIFDFTKSNTDIVTMRNISTMTHNIISRLKSVELSLLLCVDVNDGWLDWRDFR